MREIAGLAIKLFIITAVAAVCLAFTNSITKDKIVEQIALENELARQEVLSEADTYEQIDQNSIISAAESLNFENPEIVAEVFKGLKGNDEVGYTYKVLPRGYGGEISVLVGISVDGIVTGMKVVSHAETPGLGANATNDSFQNQFNDKSTEQPLSVISGGSPGDSEIEAITGATITSKAITDGANFAIEIFKEMNK
ncbi:RnfABCDGE type electron transport complex subunit G [Alkalibaculum sp. M08DMB]|uniref:Ion-translocating oxidoreductase complex subunit G n=1 Tax=Alkalibaculum sporogenes TaxID=2655001 RepID=A0A6A7K635_9FIRM|nr:RnfABCDGE type electron transport complex subunit G [Alkalibaculum sporogenes]MPW24835.1 RnfABCDGE type electron transport complex subunit G [Alkalibaculum sporogenes]